jgi:hypothetical protein
VETRYPASIVQQIHLLPSLVEVHSNEPSGHEVENHEDFANHLKKIPKTCGLSNYGEEKESGEEVVCLY